MSSEKEGKFKYQTIKKHDTFDQRLEKGIIQDSSVFEAEMSQDKF